MKEALAELTLQGLPQLAAMPALASMQRDFFGFRERFVVWEPSRCDR